MNSQTIITLVVIIAAVGIIFFHTQIVAFVKGKFHKSPQVVNPPVETSTSDTHLPPPISKA